MSRFRKIGEKSRDKKNTGPPLPQKVWDKEMAMN
jgi:hypothetical protein